MEGSKPHTEMALNHMDIFYKSVFKRLWPSIRISLLTTQKYCALLNNYHENSDEVQSYLQDLGTYNAMESAFDAHNVFLKNNTIDISNCNIYETLQSLPKRPSEVEDNHKNRNENKSQEMLPPVLRKNTSLYDFVPASKLTTEREMITEEEARSSTFREDAFEVPVSIIQEEIPPLPEQLKFFIYKKGNVSDFPKPKLKHGNLLGYYMMDASSLLPVIALDLQEQDNVLDLCAAPGGKSLAMLQLGLTENLCCIDASSSRLKRLKESFTWYLGDIPSTVSITKKNGMYLMDPIYDKVLVDVPCNTDRRVVNDEDNNLFKPGRLQERLQLTTEQVNLLVAGIKSCKPGGTVVYSTCTLNPAQNDGVIQATTEHIWKETDIDIAVSDISYLRFVFQDIFTFFRGAKYGQLVLPSLSSNFGPMYVCKIKRLK